MKRAGADGGIWCRCFAGSRISGTRRCRLEVTGLSGRAGPAAVDGTIAVRRVTESAIRPRARPAISANRGTGRLRRVAELQLAAELHPVIALTPAPNRASERTGRHARSSPAPTDEAALFHVKRGRGATEAFGAALPAGSRISGDASLPTGSHGPVRTSRPCVWSARSLYFASPGPNPASLRSFRRPTFRPSNGSCPILSRMIEGWVLGAPVLSNSLYFHELPDAL